MTATDDERIDELESQFPDLADGIFAEAYRSALAAGLSVVVSDNGRLFEVFPDGSRRFIKAITPPIATVPGQKFTIPDEPEGE